MERCQDRKNSTKKDLAKFEIKDEEEIIVKEIYIITFKSKNEPIIGNVQKLIDIKSNKILGTVLRE